MVYKKKVSKKIISLVMDDLEEAILDTKQKPTIKKRKISPVKFSPYKDKKSDYNSALILKRDRKKEL